MNSLADDLRESLPVDSSGSSSSARQRREHNSRCSDKNICLENRNAEYDSEEREEEKTDDENENDSDSVASDVSSEYTDLGEVTDDNTPPRSQSTRRTSLKSRPKRHPFSPDNYSHTESEYAPTDYSSSGAEDNGEDEDSSDDDQVEPDRYRIEKNESQVNRHIYKTMSREGKGKRDSTASRGCNEDIYEKFGEMNMNDEEAYAESENADATVVEEDGEKEDGKVDEDGEEAEDEAEDEDVDDEEGDEEDEEEQKENWHSNPIRSSNHYDDDITSSSPASPKCTNVNRGEKSHIVTPKLKKSSTFYSFVDIETPGKDLLPMKEVDVSSEDSPAIKLLASINLSLSPEKTVAESKSPGRKSPASESTKKTKLSRKEKQSNTPKREIGTEVVDLTHSPPHPKISEPKTTKKKLSVRPSTSTSSDEVKISTSTIVSPRKTKKSEPSSSNISPAPYRTPKKTKKSSTTTSSSSSTSTSVKSTSPTSSSSTFPETQTSNSVQTPQLPPHQPCIPLSGLKGTSTWLYPYLKDGDLKYFTKLPTRQQISQRLYEYFDEQVLRNVLGDLVEVKWNQRLYKTAGVTYLKRRKVPSTSEQGTMTEKRIATIELSIKVLDEPGRLYNTLAHEICHATAWIFDNIIKPPHGEDFKKWARTFHNWDSCLKITTCHEYNIRYKYNYICVDCKQCYGRHSKSIDTSQKVCGKCKGKLHLVVDKSVKKS